MKDPTDAFAAQVDHAATLTLSRFDINTGASLRKCQESGLTLCEGPLSEVESDEKSARREPGADRGAARQKMSIVHSPSAAFTSRL